MDPDLTYLLSLRAIRERAKIVGDIAQAGRLNHFNLDRERMDDVADFVTSIIQVGFAQYHATLKARRADCYPSGILGLTDMRQSLRMGGGNTLKPAMYLASQI